MQYTLKTEKHIISDPRPLEMISEPTLQSPNNIRSCPTLEAYWIYGVCGARVQLPLNINCAVAVQHALPHMPHGHAQEAKSPPKHQICPACSHLAFAANMMPHVSWTLFRLPLAGHRLHGEGESCFQSMPRGHVQRAIAWPRHQTFRSPCQVAWEEDGKPRAF